MLLYLLYYEGGCSKKLISFGKPISVENSVLWVGDSLGIKGEDRLILGVYVGYYNRFNKYGFQ